MKAVSFYLKPLQSIKRGGCFRKLPNLAALQAEYGKLQEQKEALMPTMES